LSDNKCCEHSLLLDLSTTCNIIVEANIKTLKKVVNLQIKLFKKNENQDSKKTILDNLIKLPNRIKDEDKDVENERKEALLKYIEGQIGKENMPEKKW
jgi:flagellar motor component MotA